jgi:hypothetical protein
MRIGIPIAVFAFATCFASPLVAVAQPPEHRCTATKVGGAGAAARTRLDCEAMSRLAGAFPRSCRASSALRLAQTWGVADRLGTCPGELGDVAGVVDEYADAVGALVSDPNRLVAADQLRAAGQAVAAFGSCAAASLTNGFTIETCDSRGQVLLLRAFQSSFDDLLAVTTFYQRFQHRIDAYLGDIFFAFPTPTTTSTPVPTATSTTTSTPVSTATATAVATPSCGNHGQPCCLPDLTCLFEIPCLFTTGVDTYICRFP